MPDNTFQNIADATEEITKSLANMVWKLGPDQAKHAIDVTSQMIVNSIKSRVNVSNRVVKRYSRGRLYATYHPGNLKRSIQVLDFSTSKTRAVKWIGPVMQPKGSSRGEFKGSRVDGKYAWYVEYGRRKRPYMRPGVDAVEGKVRAYMEAYIKKVLNARS